MGAADQTPPNLVVLAAPGGVLAGIRDALQDWSAVGLVEPFCWVEDPPGEGFGRVAASEVVEGRAHPVTLEGLVANRAYVRIRLCVLVPTFAGARVLEPRLEEHLAQLVKSTRGAAQVEYLRINVTRPGRGPGAGMISREGWHNIVLSPEESRGPGLGYQRLTSTDDPIEVGADAAAAICGLTGLWDGIAEAPLDGRPLLPAQHARVARAFFRRLEADKVEESVRAGVLSMAGELPKPRVDTGRAVAVENVGLATSTMADQLWAKNVDVLQGPRDQRVPVEPKPIGAGQAIKMLFRFLGAAIKGAPKAWMQDLLRRASSGIASAVQHAVLGRGESAYAVVVHGMKADGTPASWSDLGAASSQLSEIVSDPGAVAGHHAQAGLPRVWRDYVGAAFTLADAGYRTPELPPVIVGVDRGIIIRPGDCVPGPESDFTAVPVTLSSGLGVQRIEAADVLSRDELRARLIGLRTDQMVGIDADRTLSALDSWTGRYQHTFSVQSASRVAQQINNLRSEVQGLLAILAAATAELNAGSELERKQRRLAAWMRGLLIGFIVVLVALGVLGGFEVITWKIAGLCAGGALLLWIIATLVTFLRGQRDFFAELHRREKAKSQAEITKINLGHALNDLRRTTAVYGQHLVWSRLVGILLAQPFGAQEDRGSAPVLAREGLPLGMALGYAAPDPTLLGNTLAHVRRETYRAGWLTALWERLLDEAPARLGPDGADISGASEQLYGMPGSADSLLTRWVELIRGGGPGTSGAEEFWRQVSWLGGPLADGLIDRVAVDGQAISKSAFMSGIDAADGRQGAFDGGLFTATARTRQGDAVVEQWRRSVRSGLGMTAVLVELSEGLNSYELEGLEESTEHWQRRDDDTGQEF